MLSLFIGCELWDVDADGIVGVPAFLSEAFGTELATADLLISKHQADSCLVGYGRDHLCALSDRLEQLRVNDQALGRDESFHHRRMRRLFGVIEHMPAGAGMIRIPPAMRQLGHIGPLALFVGTGDSFEIWNPELALESDDEGFRDFAAYRLRTRGSVARPPERH